MTDTDDTREPRPADRGSHAGDGPDRRADAPPPALIRAIKAAFRRRSWEPPEDEPPAR